ncbi:hypothetical protein AIGOOFII_1086 [Methylobacterium marchantiae]|nr:hypothetical protein AIGOOFII_1086 [Methylobacterium marchantiae]
MSEVLPLPRLHQRPTAGGFLAGFLNLGGTALPVIDLARLLGLTSTAPDPHAVNRHLVLDARRSTAFLVDRAEDLVVVPDSDIRPVERDSTLNGCVEAEFERERSIVHVLSPSRLLSEEERARLAALTRTASERLAALDATTDP